MIRLLSCILVIAFFVQNCTNAAKVTDIVIEYVNPKYIEIKLLEVKVNQNDHSESTIDLVARVIKDFPQDTRITARMYVLNAQNQKGKRIYNARIQLCKKDEKTENLPTFFKLLQSRSECVKKGQYQINNIKDFDFASLVPDLDKKGQFFKLEFTVSSFWSGRILKGYNIIQTTKSVENTLPNNYAPIQSNPSQNRYKQ